MDLFGVLQDAYPTLLKGLATTVEVTVISLLIATVLGIITCLFRISHIPPLRWLAKFYIWLIRGTPMLVQALYIYLALPQLLQMVTGSNVKISIFTASIARLIRDRQRRHVHSGLITVRRCVKSFCHRQSRSVCRH